MYPRTRHQYTFDELATLVTNVATLRPGSRLEVRTVLVAGENAWSSFATVLRIRDDDGNCVKERIDLDRVILWANYADPQELNRPEKFQEFLTSWRREVNAGTRLEFQEKVNYQHYISRNVWIERSGWVFEPYERVPYYGQSSPEGPFLHVQANIFAESIPALAMEWLKIPLNLTDDTVQNRYYVIVPDQRARFEDLVVEEQNLYVNIVSSESALSCASVFTTPNRVNRQVKPVVNGRAEFSFPDATKEVQIWILNEDGEWLDRYTENQYGSSWKPFSLFSTPRGEFDPRLVELNEALASGETNTIEFKQYIKIARGNNKAEEILKTVIAFANAQGGTLYIGVNDDVEPVGVDRDLKGDYAASCHGDQEAMEHAYIRDVRKLIAEGIDPSPVIMVEWVSFTYHRILKVSIPRGTIRPSALAANGDIFIRTGANNRKLRQAEISTYFAAPQDAAAAALARTVWNR